MPLLYEILLYPGKNQFLLGAPIALTNCRHLLAGYWLLNFPVLWFPYGNNSKDLTELL